MRFRIPPHHRETVTIVRKSATNPSEEEVIADGVICMIQPVSQREAVEVRNGVAIQETDRMVLLSKPNPAIKKGDFLRQADSSQFRIMDVLGMRGSPVQKLYLRATGVL